jgi:hypothetical protein
MVPQGPSIWRARRVERRALDVAGEQQELEQMTFGSSSRACNRPDVVKPLPDQSYVVEEASGGARC